MAEYIEREALIENLRELHKAEIRIYNWAKSDTERRERISGCIAVAECIVRAKEQPTADVVEVVRCKDCRHFCPYEGEEHKGDCNELVGLESCVYEDDFCSYSEAKMDGKGEGE